MQAIKAKCLDCCCGSTREVAKCPAVNCPLYEFRKGKRKIKEKKAFEDLTDEEKAVRKEKAEILKKGRENKKKSKIS